MGEPTEPQLEDMSPVNFLFLMESLKDPFLAHYFIQWARLMSVFALNKPKNVLSVSTMFLIKEMDKLILSSLRW